MKILALCGSLRSGSLNAAVLRSAADLLVPLSELIIEPDLGRLPLFNPDVAENDLPEARQSCGPESTRRTAC